MKKDKKERGIEGLNRIKHKKRKSGFQGFIVEKNIIHHNEINKSHSYYFGENGKKGEKGGKGVNLKYNNSRHGGYGSGVAYGANNNSYAYGNAYSANYDKWTGITKNDKFTNDNKKVEDDSIIDVIMAAEIEKLIYNLNSRMITSFFISIDRRLKTITFTSKEVFFEENDIFSFLNGMKPFNVKTKKVIKNRFIREMNYSFKRDFKMDFSFLFIKEDCITKFDINIDDFLKKYGKETEKTKN